MLRRPALVAALAALALGAGTAGAAPAPQIADPVGDAVGSQASYDLKSVTFEVTRKAGKPSAYVVTMELAGAAAVQPGVSYQIGVDTGCGHMFVFAYFSALDAGVSSSMQVATCGADDPTDVDGNAGVQLEHTLTTSGNKIIFSAPYGGVPKDMGVGTSYEEPVAYTALTEPAVGYTTADFVPETAIDYATGDGFKLK